MLENKHAIAVYSSASDFPPDAATIDEDHQKPLMRQWLRFIGVDVVEGIAVAPTLADSGHLLRVEAVAVRQARAAARALEQAQG